MARFSETTISKLADDLGSHENVAKLGRALGIERVKINQYLATNRADGNVSSRGTSNMLFDWNQATPKKDQICIMRTALYTAGYAALAEEYCQETSTGNASGAASLSWGARSAATCVSEAELMKLSKLVSGDYYSPLATALGLSYAECVNIRTKHQLNIEEATLEILHRWKNKTEGFHHDLDEALRQAECNGLVSKYKKSR